MTILGRGYKWIAHRWYIPLVVLGALVLWLVTRFARAPAPAPRKAVADELDQIRRDESFQRLAAEQGAALANQLVDQEYQATLRELDAKQQSKAERLRGNPGKRLRFLRRLSKRLERRAADNVGG